MVQFILVGAVYHNALTNCAALLCRACGDFPVCVAVRYLTLRIGCERYGRKNPLPYSFSKRSHIGNLRQTNKQGKGRSSKRKGNRRCPFLFAHRRGYGAVPAAGAAISRAPQSATPRLISSEKPLARKGTNTLTQFEYPTQPVLKKLPPGKGRTRLRSSSTPLSRC